jgi:hypothetical protein
MYVYEYFGNNGRSDPANHDVHTTTMIPVALENAGNNYESNELDISNFLYPLIS